MKKVGTSTSGKKEKREYKGEKRTSSRKNTNPYATITPFKGFRTNELTKRIRSNEKLKKNQKASSSGAKTKDIAHKKTNKQGSKILTPRKKKIQEK